MDNKKRRLSHLEKKRPRKRKRPDYISVSDLAELEGKDLQGVSKVYVGISPDDWDRETEDQKNGQ